MDVTFLYAEELPTYKGIGQSRNRSLHASPSALVKPRCGRVGKGCVSRPELSKAFLGGLRRLPLAPPPGAEMRRPRSQVRRTGGPSLSLSELGTPRQFRPWDRTSAAVVE